MIKTRQNTTNMNEEALAWKTWSCQSDISYFAKLNLAFFWGGGGSRGHENTRTAKPPPVSKNASSCNGLIKPTSVLQTARLWKVDRHRNGGSTTWMALNCLYANVGNYFRCFWKMEDCLTMADLHKLCSRCKDWLLLRLANSHLLKYLPYTGFPAFYEIKIPRLFRTFRKNSISSWILGSRLVEVRSFVAIKEVPWCYMDCSPHLLLFFSLSKFPDSGFPQKSENRIPWLFHDWFASFHDSHSHMVSDMVMTVSHNMHDNHKLESCHSHEKKQFHDFSMTFWEIFIFQDFSMTFHDNHFFQDFSWPWEPCWLERNLVIFPVFAWFPGLCGNPVYPACTVEIKLRLLEKWHC